MPRREEIGVREAARTALAAQGFTRRRPEGPVQSRHLLGVLDRLAVVQIDSVNVVSRSHYLPFLARVGPYDRSLLDRLLLAPSRRPRQVLEYWAHEASFVVPEVHRLLRWRMRRAAEEGWGGMVRAAREHPTAVEQVVAAVRAEGPLTAAEVEARVGSRGPVSSQRGWGWNWSLLKAALEYAFWAGAVSAAGRSSSFARLYDVPERVLPPALLTASDPTPEEAVRGLVEVGARALGVATEASLADYVRQPRLAARTAVGELVESGVLEPVRVRGWERPAYRHRDAVSPRRVQARALLSPFDSLVWHRERTEQLFGFRYRIEIYVPAEKRQHGYYVLPFLLGQDLVARVDLKADRQAGVLRVQAAWAEETAPPHAPSELAAELQVMASWLGLDHVVVTGPGDLAPSLVAALRAADPL